MITRSPFAAISYNTDDFLKMKLNDLIVEGVLQFWYFINHKAEVDEKSDHKHVYFVPCKQVDTFVLQNYFDEFDPKCPDLPLKTRIGAHAKFADKYLYDLHDKDYLASKGLERKFVYSHDDIVSSDDDYLWELVHTSDFTKWKKEADFKNAIRRRETFDTLLEKGFVPIQQIYQYQKAYDILINKFYPCRQGEKLYREIIDYDTGVATYVPYHFTDDEDEGV